MTAVDIISAIEEHGGVLDAKPGGGLTLKGAAKVPREVQDLLRAHRDDVWEELTMGFREDVDAARAGRPAASAAPAATPAAEPAPRPGLRLRDDRVLAGEVRRLAAGWRALGVGEPEALAAASRQVTGSDLPLFCAYLGNPNAREPGPEDDEWMRRALEASKPCRSLDGGPGIVARYDSEGAPYCESHAAWALSGGDVEALLAKSANAEAKRAAGISEKSAGQ